MSCKNKLKQECFDELEQFIVELSNTKGELITVLHRAQEIFGYLPVEVQRFVGEKMNVSCAKIFGVVSFYSFFTMTPKGKNAISVCMGTACFVKGADKILKDIENKLNIKSGETTQDGLYSIDALRCVGACGLAPVVMVGKKIYGNVILEDINGILETHK